MLSRFGSLRKPIFSSLFKNKNVIISAVRNSHACQYRVAPPPAPKIIRIGAEVTSAFMWWWILWHLWHEYGHITGEFPYPATKEWTNEELGIPTD